LIEKSRKEVKSKLELWKQTLESKGFCLNRNKGKYMYCYYSNQLGKINWKCNCEKIPHKFQSSDIWNQLWEIKENVRQRCNLDD